MRTEQRLADLIYSRNPTAGLIGAEFENTDAGQVLRFHARMVKRVEERISTQFGGSLALLEERTGQTAKAFAEDFACSPEYRLVREDLNEQAADSESRLEIGFLNFVLRSFAKDAAFLEEFGEIYLAELALT